MSEQQDKSWLSCSSHYHLNSTNKPYTARGVGGAWNDSSKAPNHQNIKFQQEWNGRPINTVHIKPLGGHVALDKTWTPEMSSKAPAVLEAWAPTAPPLRSPHCCAAATGLTQLSSSSPLIPPRLWRLKREEAPPVPLAPTSIWIRCHACVLPRGPGFLCITAEISSPVSSTRLFLILFTSIKLEPQRAQCSVNAEWTHYWINAIPHTAPCFDNKYSFLKEIRKKKGRTIPVVKVEWRLARLPQSITNHSVLFLISLWNISSWMDSLSRSQRSPKKWCNL